MQIVRNLHLKITNAPSTAFHDKKMYLWRLRQLEIIRENILHMGIKLGHRYAV
jgi:hypothetical protein